MAKTYGKIGFGKTIIKPGGVSEFVITERDYKIDIIRPSVRNTPGEDVIPGLSTGNSFSIIEDGYLSENLFAMKYVTWMGVRWSVRKIDQAHPRLIITVGEVFNGPSPTTT